MTREEPDDRRDNDRQDSNRQDTCRIARRTGRDEIEEACDSIVQCLGLRPCNPRWRHSGLGADMLGGTRGPGQTASLAGPLVWQDR